MENATQALLIGAGVLIGVLILSLAVYLFNTFGAYATDTQKKVDEKALAQLNAKFYKYDGLEDINIQDIITIKNYAIENNKKDSNYNWEQNRADANNEYIDVFYGKRNNLRLIFGESDEHLLKSESTKKFTCEVEVNAQTGRINRVFFYEMSN